MTPAPDPEQARAAIEYCYARGWSDGLPLVPASQPLVEQFLATTTKSPDEVIGELEQVGRTCEFVDNRHTADPEHVLNDIADTISRTGSLIFKDTSAGVVFCPEHAQMLASAGFTKKTVQEWLMEHCGRTGADLRRAGKNGLRGIARFADADTSQDDTFTRILPSPRHVPIVVAGARNAAISMVVRIFGEWSGTASATEPVLTMVRS